MGVRVECDWCGQAIPPGDPYVTVEFDGCHRKGANAIEAVTEPARVYCGADRYTDDDPAAHAAVPLSGGQEPHWGHRESCYRRMLTALTGDPFGRADRGLEWQLVPQPAPRPGYVLDVGLDEVPVPKPVRAALRRFGLERARDIARLTQAELIAIPGIGVSRSDDIALALHQIAGHGSERRIKREVTQA